MKIILSLLSFALIVFIVGCNQGNRQQPQENNQGSANENNKNNDEDNDDDGSGNSFVEGMKNLENMMKEGGKYEAVDFRKLKEFLPEELDDMKRVSANGEKTNSYGVNVSKVEGKYENEDKTSSIKITITDLGSMKGFAGLAAFAWTFAEIDKETETGFERTTKYDDNKAFEKYDSQNQQGSVDVFVGKRFMVEVNGYNVPMERIQSAARDVGLDELESMKQAGKKTDKTD